MNAGTQRTQRERKGREEFILEKILCALCGIFAPFAFGIFELKVKP
jgi:hypothetical protein